jgi:hypothetical protein
MLAFEQQRILGASATARCTISIRRRGVWALTTRNRYPGFSQFSHASAPTMPQAVHTMRGPNAGTGMSAGHRSALMVVALAAVHRDQSDGVLAHIAEGQRAAVENSNLIQRRAKLSRIVLGS